MPGCPIRESPGHRSFASYPKLIAGSYALHRLLVPRHPPYALLCLFYQIRRLGFQQLVRRLPAEPCSATLVIRSQRQPPLTYEDVKEIPTPWSDSGKQAAASSFTSLGQPSEDDHRGSLKEVIQPQVPLRLPCYDFTPIIDQTVGASLPWGWVNDFGSSQLSWCDGRCVQGPGTYSPRHSDPRLLAIPTSWSRVADSNLN